MPKTHAEKNPLFHLDRNSISLFIFFAALAIFFFWLLWPQAAASDKSLGQCLAERGVTMYGVDTCSSCLEQKEMFGKDFSNVPYVNCSFRQELCLERGVKVYPVWSMDNQVLIGTQSLQSLAGFSGCPLDE